MDMDSSDEEVRRKPTHEQSIEEPSTRYDKVPSPQRRPPSQNAPTEFANLDILVIGRSGMGKSSTVDKLMVLNTQNSHCQLAVDFSVQITHSLQNRKTTMTVDDHREQPQLLYTYDTASQDLYDQTTEEPEVTIDEIGTIKYQNFGNLVQSRDPEEHKKAVERLTNLKSCTQLNKESELHTNIDKLRNAPDNMSIYGHTKSCQLLSNTNSKIRALDTPGFFTCDLDLSKVQKINIEDVNLAIVQDIIHVQAAANLKFQRILYFLPQSGPLKGIDQTLLEEIQKLVKFFGHSIFKSMVLVGTVMTHLSQNTKFLDEDKFPEEELRKTRSIFQEALVRVVRERNEDTEGLPEPPIIFIAMTDTCEEILEKTMSARVESSNGLQIEFNSKTCRRCAMEIGIRDGKSLICEYRRPGQTPWVDAIPHNESFCHPKVQEKRIPWPLEIVKFFGFQWHSTEFACVECGMGPGSFGCMKVGTKTTIKNGTINVEHDYINY